ncbi:hypothetical protein AAZV13_04G170600 [Glycine max]
MACGILLLVLDTLTSLLSPRVLYLSSASFSMRPTLSPSFFVVTGRWSSPPASRLRSLFSLGK